MKLILLCILVFGVTDISLAQWRPWWNNFFGGGGGRWPWWQRPRPTTTTTTTPRPWQGGGTSSNCGSSIYTERGSASRNQISAIVGGTGALPNEFPYQARLNYNGGFVCGGTVLSDRHILTAAHCVSDSSPFQFQVTLGDHNRQRYESGEQNYRISRLITHPQYSERINRNDVAIMVTQTPIQFSSAIRPVCLPDSRTSLSNIAGQRGIITGWGKLSENGPSSSVLQKAYVNVWSDNQCKQSYGYSEITPDMFCSGYTYGGVDTCQGDSGGPLVIMQNNRYYVYGVTSWGYGCAQRNYPGVYSLVPTSVDWIRSIISSA